MAQVGALAVVCAAWLGMVPARAQACGGLLCEASIYFPAQGTVPANLPGFYWWPSTTGSDVRDWDDAGAWEDDPSTLPKWLRLARVDGATPEWLEVTLHDPDAQGGPYLVVPNVPLVPGGEYLLWDVTGCDAEPLTLDALPTEDQLNATTYEGWPHSFAHVTAGAVTPLPDALGSLSATDPGIGRIKVADGQSCWDFVDTQRVELTLAHDAASQAWRDAFFYVTEVDGAPYAPDGTYNYLSTTFDPTPGTSFVGRGRDLVYTDCEPVFYVEGVEQGPHRARFRATIPGTGLALQTNEVTFTLTCPERRDARSDAGPSDAGGDAALGDMDAAVDVDASVPGRPRADPSERDGGCSVADPTRGASWPLLLALGWLARRRRV